MPGKLTDSEIVKALEELLKELKSKKQLIVPEQGVKNLCYGLQNFLNLINRLQVENERFKNSWKADVILTIRTEAYKEFAERLCEGRVSNDNTVILAKCLLKELVSEQPPLNDVKCKDCEYLELELPYAVCSKAYKGIVAPDDSCGKGKLKELVGDYDDNS